MANVRSITLDRLREQLKEMGGARTLSVELPAEQAAIAGYQAAAGRDPFKVTPHLKSEASREVRRHVEQTVDLRTVRPWEIAADVARRVVTARFDSDGGDARWAPVTAAYAAYKAALGKGHLTLVFDKALRAAIAAAPFRWTRTT